MEQSPFMRGMETLLRIRIIGKFWIQFWLPNFLDDFEQGLSGFSNPMSPLPQCSVPCVEPTYTAWCPPPQPGCWCYTPGLRGEVEQAGTLEMQSSLWSLWHSLTCTNQTRTKCVQVYFELLLRGCYYYCSLVEAAPCSLLSTLYQTKVSTRLSTRLVGEWTFCWLNLKKQTKKNRFFYP